jgi:3-hydroxy-9,10-secoandrosta-1,3,5(10)-triene-9,17-dione monooxygenase reductase component
MPMAHATQPAEPELDERSLRLAFGRWATGVAFVTTELDGAPLGLIVSSFAAVSLRPPLVSFCPARDSLTWRRMRLAGRFTVNVLGADHGDFARRAAAPGADRFAEPEVLRDVVAVFECGLDAEHVAGDHSIVVGRVRRVQVASADRPLVYLAGGFGAFHPHHEEPPCPPN